jgi:hypothetical protein
MGARIHRVEEKNHPTHHQGVLSAVPGPNEWSASRPEKDIGLAKSSAKQTGQMDLSFQNNSPPGPNQWELPKGRDACRKQGPIDWDIVDRAGYRLTLLPVRLFRG